MNETLRRLAEPVPRHLIRTRRKAGSDLAYLEWFTVNRLLDERAPGWSGSVESVSTVTWDRQDKDRDGNVISKTPITTIFCTYTLRIPTEDGVIERTAIGSDDMGSGYDPVASAEQQAFKRAAARFGLGLELYDKETAPKPQRPGQLSREEWLARKANK
ncbi:MAG: hypothetical protein HC818_00055 [Synechococcaceae cyanobacterium RM1_1_27]|nr:hypothetical protein [Synechococcaceae cyanobacterium RM1_1_27]